MSSLPTAQARPLVQDLIDALWLEDLYGFRRHCTVLSAGRGDATLAVWLGGARSLRWRGQPADGLRPFRVSDAVAMLDDGTSAPVAAGLSEAADALETAAWWGDRTGRFGRALRLAIEQAAFTAAHEHRIVERITRAAHDLVSWEALTCLRDRPFHPLARAKDWGGINAGDGPDTGLDAAGYAVESLRPIALRWLAVPRDRVIGRSDGQPIADRVLDAHGYHALAAAAGRQHAAADRYLWMPVHPAQWRYLKAHASAALQGCIDLDVQPDAGLARPTASLRSLALDARPDVHLKLSLSISALGAVRTLPPRYLHNGALANAYLAQLRQADGWLAQHLLLCDESQWWAARQRDALEAEPGELACLLRRYPMLPDAQLVPMAALPAVTAAGALPAFDVLLGASADEPRAWRLFSEIAHALFELGLRCFAHGVMPELHGQNVVLAFRAGQVAALVLRDHDTLRVCPALLPTERARALDYVVDRSTPNTLELDTPRQLLGYLQTLAIEVNLYAVLAALATRYGRDEAHGWRIVRQASEAALAGVRLPAAVAGETADALLEAPAWPFKQVLAPVLARAQAGTGMPSAMGQLPNPLRGLHC